MEHSIDEIKQTVIYTIEIETANAGAWYATNRGQQFNCILEIVDKTFGGQEIMYRLMGSFKPVKYIKLHHVQVVSSRIATHKELLNFYGGK